MTPEEVAAVVKTVMENHKQTSRPLVTSQLILSICVLAVTAFLSLKTIALIPSDIEAARKEAHEAAIKNEIQEVHFAVLDKQWFMADYRINKLEPRMDAAEQKINYLDKRTPDHAP